MNFTKHAVTIIFRLCLLSAFCFTLHLSSNVHLFADGTIDQQETPILLSFLVLALEQAQFFPEKKPDKKALSMPFSLEGTLEETKGQFYFSPPTLYIVQMMSSDEDDDTQEISADSETEEHSQGEGLETEPNQGELLGIVIGNTYLPPEIIEQIACHLDTHSFLRLACVNRALYQLLNSYTFCLRYVNNRNNGNTPEAHLARLVLPLARQQLETSSPTDDHNLSNTVWRWVYRLYHGDSAQRAEIASSLNSYLSIPALPEGHALKIPDDWLWLLRNAPSFLAQYDDIQGVISTLGDLPGSLGVDYCNSCGTNAVFLWEGNTRVVLHRDLNNRLRNSLLQLRQLSPDQPWEESDLLTFENTYISELMPLNNRDFITQNSRTHIIQIYRRSFTSEHENLIQLANIELKQMAASLIPFSNERFLIRNALCKLLFLSRVKTGDSEQWQQTIAFGIPRTSSIVLLLGTFHNNDAVISVGSTLYLQPYPPQQAFQALSPQGLPMPSSDIITGSTSLLFENPLGGQSAVIAVIPTGQIIAYLPTARKLVLLSPSPIRSGNWEVISEQPCGESITHIHSRRDGQIIAFSHSHYWIFSIYPSTDKRRDRL